MAKSRVVAIRRTRSHTPLAQHFERALSGRDSRKPKAIPWSSFRRSAYPQPALELAASAQRALAVGEYSAVDLFARLASGLSQHGAPLDFVLEATRIPSDEARHAEYALRMAELCAGEPVEVEWDPAAVAKRWQKPFTQEGLDRFLIEVAAIGETLAAALIGACGERASDPVARALFRSVLGDEVHHARLGWYYLSWRAPQWTLSQKQRLADSAGEMVAGVEVAFFTGRDAPRGSKKAARALGVLDSATQRKVVRRVMEDEVVPGLDALGLGASHAWRVRRRGKA